MTTASPSSVPSFFQNFTRGRKFGFYTVSLILDSNNDRKKYEVDKFYRVFFSFIYPGFRPIFWPNSKCVYFLAHLIKYNSTTCPFLTPTKKTSFFDNFWCVHFFPHLDDFARLLQKTVRSIFRPTQRPTTFHF